MKKDPRKLTTVVPDSFRIWDGLHGRWFWGDTDDKSRQLQTDSIHFFGEVMTFGETFHDPHEDGVWKGIGFVNMLEWLTLVPSTRMWTEDKKEIFNGDFLETCEGGSLGLVYYDLDLGGYAVWHLGDSIPLGKFLKEESWKPATIVGNAFENPELANKL